MHAAHPFVSSAKYTRNAWAGTFGSLVQLFPDSLVRQRPFSVTIQPALSFRKNSEKGFSFSGTTCQCAPASEVTIATDFRLVPSVTTPTATPRDADGN